MKENVLETTLAAYRQGLFAGTSGNLSLCDETRGILAITPSSFPYEKMTIDDIMVIRMADGSVVEGPHKPSSEWRMHTAILKGRPDVFGVVHTHSPYATSFAVAMEAKAAGRAPDKAVFDHTLALTDARYAGSAAQATYLVDKIPDDATLMTQCFAETDVGAMLRECRARGKTIKVICPETRPYFQGARLTASVVRDIGFEVTVITDNMPAWAMKAKGVDLFTSAADLRHPTIDTVAIEESDGEEVLEAMGVRTAMRGVRGWYPAFDITPPELCVGIVTDKGIFPPYDLARYLN